MCQGRVSEYVGDEVERIQGLWSFLGGTLGAEKEEKLNGYLDKQDKA